MSGSGEPSASVGAGEEKRATAQGDSPKRQGDKLRSGAESQVTEAQSGPTGDSPKPHGEKLNQAVAEAAKD